MLLHCDKFFVEELQKAGYDIDYKQIIDIYKRSRLSSGYQKRKKMTVDELYGTEQSINPCSIETVKDIP